MKGIICIKKSIIINHSGVNLLHLNITLNYIRNELDDSIHETDFKSEKRSQTCDTGKKCERNVLIFN
jgi:hypothetical protein